jgi:hypothetical protein
LSKNAIWTHSLSRFTQDKKDVVKKEIARLLDVSFIKELYHPDWLTNHILVPKKNKACKRDPFGLPWINQVVDSTAGCSLLSFLDCYSGYHQIILKVDEQIKSSFITLFGVFCYTTMPFDSKARVQLVSGVYKWCLYSQLGLNTEVYVDDVVVKTWEEEGLISDLAKTFDNLSKFKMKLNPEKCSFGVPSGKLVGYMVSRHGIDTNPEKVLAIMKMKPPESLHDIQKLMGCMATLSRFMS